MEMYRTANPGMTVRPRPWPIKWLYLLYFMQKIITPRGVIPVFLLSLLAMLVLFQASGITSSESNGIPISMMVVSE